MLPVLPRQPEVVKMIDEELYFIFHAPRQSGKTTFFDALTDEINSNGNYYVLYCSLMTLRSITDEKKAMDRVVSQLNDAMESSQVKSIKQKAYSYNSLQGMEAPDIKVKSLLNQLCLDLDRDLIVIFDEADCLSRPGLITFLSQISCGYNNRYMPGNKFPRALALVGMRNISYYIPTNHPNDAPLHLTSYSDIFAESVTLANFTHSQIKALYHQHTEATGQVFEDDAVDRAWYWSEGQPWLVNALAKFVIENELNDDYSNTISSGLIDQVADSLFKRQDAHLDSLLNRLKDPRVIKVMQPVFAGTESGTSSSTDDDLQYCKDL
jgi:hypothetical protein